MVLNSTSEEEHPRRRPRRRGTFLGAVVLGVSLVGVSIGGTAWASGSSGTSNAGAAQAARPMTTPWVPPSVTWTGTTPPVSVPTTTRPQTCDGVPPRITVLDVGETSFRVSYTLSQIPGCGGGGLYLYLYTQDDFGEHPVNYTSTGEGQTLTVSGLNPGTDYYWRASGGSSPFTTWGGPVHTLGTAPPPSPSCSALYEEVTRWDGGFTVRLTVNNTSHVTVPGWKVTWNWPGDERIVRATGARVSGPVTSPVLTGIGRQRSIKDAGNVIIDLVVRAPSNQGTFQLTPVCTVTR